MGGGPSHCLPEDVVLGFFAGTLSPAQLETLELHVDACAGCRAWLSGVATSLEGGDAPRVVDGGRCFATNTIVAGRYCITRFIAAGGMGEVYEADDLELHQAIALKAVTVMMAGNRDAIAAMRAEVALARKVTHRNVCRIFDFGIDDASGVAFLTMELLGGETLAVRLARAGAMTPASALPLVAQMADGLAAAHAAGVVHRDLKPHNVIVVDGEDGPRAVLTDFGLAVVLDGEQTLAPVGTPRYMAPEQLAGGPITVATDVYAFGVMLHQMVSGELPGEPAERAEPARIATDARWAAAIARCLEPDPASRFSSMRDVLAAVAPRSARRRSWRLVGAALALAIIAGGLALAARRAAPSSAPVPCPARSPEAGDLYVAAAAGAGGNGTAACPLRTIGEALAAPRHGHVTIHVGAGRYDRDHGEHFPLVVRGDVTIAGAGPALTRIVGTGTLDQSYGPLEHEAASLVIGDVRDRVVLATLSIEGDTPQPELGRFGIVCDRGNLTDFSAAPPAANTTLTGLSIGPGYTDGVVVSATHDGVRSGCNLALVGSTLRSSYGGVWTTGCSDRGDTVPVRAEIGDDTEAGRNVFTALRSPERRGAAITAWDCTLELLIRRNLMIDSDAGVSIVRHPPSQKVPDTSHIVVAHNRFQGLSWLGIGLWRTARIDVLDGNDFVRNVGRAGARSERAVALVLDADGEPPPAYPQVRRARNNRFVRNDVAIELRGTELDPASPALDFGRRGDPGNNVLACNATDHGAAAAGFDVELSVPSRGALPIAFAGNVWDHAPPSVAHGDGRNGTDIELPAGPSAGLETTGATVYADHCADDR